MRTLFTDPALRDWSNGQLSDADIKAKYLGQRSPDVDCFLIICDGATVGFAQLHIADDGKEGGGMDMGLMEAAQRRGIGKVVVQHMVQLARDEKGWSRFTVDPDVANEGAVAFWQKVGFIPEHIARDDQREYWIMVWPQNETSPVPDKRRER